MALASRLWPFFTLGLLITLIRLYVLSTSGHNLYADEAQYWDWSRQLEWGYYSKPPMVAFIIALTTGLCGDSEFCIRLGSPLLHFLTSLVLFFTGRTLYNSTIGAWAMLTYLTLPAVSFSSLLISTDPPLLLCWSLCLLCFAKALESNTSSLSFCPLGAGAPSARSLLNVGEHANATGDNADGKIWWLLAGVAAGLGMLSKYTMVLLFPSFLLYLFFTPSKRHLLTHRHFWLAAVVALAIYTPNILWNAQHGFVSYLHTKDISRLDKTWLHPLQFLEFLAAQAVMIGPVLLGVLVFSFRKPENSTRLLHCAILPLLLLITALSLLSKAEANWAAPVYSTASLLVVVIAFNWRKPWMIYGSVVLHLVAMLLLYAYTPPQNSAKWDPSYRLKGWQEMGERLTGLAYTYPNATLLFDDRKTLASMLYYAKEAAATARKWNQDGVIQDHYDLMRDINTLPKGDNFLFITRSPSIFYMKGNFHYVNRLDDIIITVYPDYSLHYRVYYCEGFTGY